MYYIFVTPFLLLNLVLFISIMSIKILHVSFYHSIVTCHIILSVVLPYFLSTPQVRQVK